MYGKRGSFALLCLLFKSLVYFFSLCYLNVGYKYPQIHIRNVLQAEQSTSVYLSMWEFSSFSRWFCTTITCVYCVARRTYARVWVRERPKQCYGLCSWFHGQSSLNLRYDSSTYVRWRSRRMDELSAKWIERYFFQIIYAVVGFKIAVNTYHVDIRCKTRG